MFRLFLRKKILSGGSKKALAEAAKNVARERKNRRVATRYPVDHKHLTLMNDADILLVREISARGFSTEVSERGFKRLVVGDVYDARIRYLGELHDLQARVTWKADSYVGFEIVKSTRETMAFVKRIIRPIEIALSLAPVDSAFMTDGQSGKSWFHGEEDVDLYVWNDPQTQSLTAWQLSIGDQYVEWKDSSGLTTGRLKGVSGADAIWGGTLKGPTQTQDARVDPALRQLAIDVIMALQYPVREHLLETLAA